MQKSSLLSLCFIVAMLLITAHNTPHYMANAADISGTQASQNNDDFLKWVEDFKIYAREKGISDDVLTTAFLGIDKPLERVIKSDRKQPEFSLTFWKYYANTVSEKRIRRARLLASTHQKLLEEVYNIYGVPPQYLLAFWGLESNFGDYTGKIPTIHALATLAFDLRRRDFFTTELVEALKIIQNGDITRDAMRGSWAGAMGQTQFMPSTFTHYAVDGDGDGKRNLWASLPDIFHSSAHFLKNIGWKPQQIWGRQVMIPKNFDYRLADIKIKKPLSFWQGLGIRRINGNPLPQNDKMQASIILPMGHEGPAFLIYDNFRVIMRWNNSPLYALSVGLLADHIAGYKSTDIQLPSPLPKLAITNIKKLQQKLNMLGFDAGPPDGIIGSKTRRAIRQFQEKNNLINDGYPNWQTFKAAGIL